MDSENENLQKIIDDIEEIMSKYPKIGPALSQNVEISWLKMSAGDMIVKTLQIPILRLIINDWNLGI